MVGRAAANHLPAPSRSLPEMIAEWAEPLPDVDDAAFGRMFDRFAGRVVLLGEASHCTAEFYRARAAITRRLIEQHGFTIVAVEADWPDAAAIDRYVRHRPAPAHGADEALRRRLVEPRPERFIGVIYRPETELMSHYADASLAKQFDAYVWFDETTAVTPLGPEHARSGVPDTYPFGL